MLFKNQEVRTKTPPLSLLPIPFLMIPKKTATKKATASVNIYDYGKEKGGNFEITKKRIKVICYYIFTLNVLKDVELIN